jgi:translation initiation factor IF-2
VLDKIDLDAIDSSTRPKKSAKKETAVPEKAKKADKEEKEAPAEKKEAAPVAEIPVAPKEPEVKPVAGPAVIEPPMIENIQAQKLTGPKILGKIELPVDNDTRPKKESNEDKRKRKRIPIEKKPGTPMQGPGTSMPPRGNRAIPDNRGGGGRTARHRALTVLPSRHTVLRRSVKKRLLMLKRSRRN